MPVDTTQLYKNFTEALSTSNVEQLKEIIKSPEFTNFIKRYDQSDFNPLVNIIGLKNADAALIDLYITKGGNINKENKGATPLFTALQIGNEELISSLLRNKADINKLFTIPESPLTKALQSKDDISKEASHQETPLTYAIRNKNERIIDLLIKHGADISKPNSKGEYPIQIAEAKGYNKLAERLTHQADNTGDSPLMIAIRSKQPKLVEYLLSKGADIHKVNKNGLTALHFAAMYGDQSLIETLITKGAKVNQLTQNGNTPLMLTAQQGNLEAAKTLLNNGAFVEHQNNTQNTALTIIGSIPKKNFNRELLDLLLDRGADLNHLNKEGIGILAGSILNNNNDLLDHVLKRKVRVNFLDKEGLSPLHLAAFEGNEYAITKLLENGADVNLKGKFGFTAAHLAASAFNPTILRKLINHKAFDPTITNDERETFDVVFARKLNPFSSLDSNELAKDRENAMKFLESVEIMPLIKSKLEEQLKQNKPELLPEGRYEYSVPELIKSVSIPYKPKDREAYNYAIDAAWTVAEEAASRRDLSLKANLSYYASQIVESLNQQKQGNEVKGKEIVYIDSHGLLGGGAEVSGGYYDDKLNRVAVALDPSDLPYTIDCIMHEIMHDTIDSVFKNDAAPNKKKGGLEDTKTIKRQMTAFTEDIKALYELTKLSAPEKAARLEELSKRVGDLITPFDQHKNNPIEKKELKIEATKLKDLKSMKALELDYGKRQTKKHYSSLFTELYVEKGARGNKKIILGDSAEQRELEFREKSVRKELYTFLYSQKAHEYTRDIEKHGEITRPSKVEKYVPNILASFEQDFAEHILPALKDRLTAIEQGSGIKIEGAATTLEQIDAYLENRRKMAAAEKKSSKRTTNEELKDSKDEKQSWASKFEKNKKLKSPQSHSTKTKHEKEQKHKRQHSIG
jgi:ankyrin repeat protein